jgi:hypothetical protein
MSMNAPADQSTVKLPVRCSLVWSVYVTMHKCHLESGHVDSHECKCGATTEIIGRDK